MRRAPVFDKDMMKEISGEMNNLSEAEKEQRAQSLKKLLDAELKRRNHSQKKAKPFSLLSFFKRK